jgi:hypothetical protein
MTAPTEEELAEIDDVDLRKYLRKEFPRVVDDGEFLVGEYGKLDPQEKANLHAAGDDYLHRVILLKLPTWDWEKVKAAMAKRIWAGFCVMEEGKGKPDPGWEQIFQPGKIGRKFVEAAMLGGFAAAGTAVAATTAGAGLGALIASAGIGASLENLLVKTVCKVLDEEVRSSLGAFCNTPK